MSQQGLEELIRAGLERQGFARVGAAEIQEVFPSAEGETAPSPELQDFALRHGWGFSHPEAAQSDEYLFYPLGSAPAAPPPGTTPEKAAPLVAGESPAEKLQGSEPVGQQVPGVQNPESTIKKEFNPNTE